MSDSDAEFDFPRMPAAAAEHSSTTICSGSLTSYRLGQMECVTTKYTFSTVSCGLRLSGPGDRGNRLRFGDGKLIDPSAMRPGSFAFNPAGCDVEAEIVGATEMVGIVVNWDADTISTVDDFRAYGAQNIRPQYGFYDPLIEMTLRTLHSEFKTLQTTNRLFADAATAMILTRIIALNDRAAVPKPRGGGLAPWQLRRTMDYLLANLASTVPLGELAGICGLSQAHFSRAFKRSTGMPPHQWQLQQRLGRAQHMLLHTNLPIQAIGIACGFDDQLYFSRLFRRRLGMSPRQWRAANRR